MELPGWAFAFGLRLDAWVERAPPIRWPDGRWTAVLDADRAGDRAVIRAPRPGERFAPLGMTGHKAVVDALAEAGIPPEDRSRHPVLASPPALEAGQSPPALEAGDSPGDELLWVLGYRISHRVRVGGNTRRFLWITAEAGAAGE